MRRVTAATLVAIPFLFLALNALAWLRIGIDIPIWDDWRILLSGRAGSLKLEDLFRPENDTLAPVGKAIDALAMRTIGGNTVMYQAITLVTVLGSVLLMQAYLLRKVLGPTLVAAAAFALTAVSTGNWTYWGQSTLGYHQAVPVVCILAVMVLFASRPKGTARLAVAGLTVGLIAGLTYVSGAVAMLVAGAAMVVLPAFAQRRPEWRRRLAWLGGGVLVAGAITTALQFSALVLLRPEGTSLGLSHPIQLDYWLFMLGVVADGLLLDPGRPLISGLIALGMVVLFIVTALTLLFRLWRRHTSHREALASVIFLSVAAGVTAYLLLVAIGRLELIRAASGDGFDPFAAGFDRPYQWWLTAVWPWAAAAIALLALRRSRLNPQATRILEVGAVAVAVAVIGLGFARGTFDYDHHYQTTSDQRVAILECIESALTDDDADCGFRRWDQDGLVDGTINGDQVGASFVRNLQPPPVGRERDILYRGSTLASRPDGTLSIVTESPAAMARCQVLEFRADAKSFGGGDLSLETWPVTVQRRRPDEVRLERPWGAARQRTITRSNTSGPWPISSYLFARDGFQDEIRLSRPGGSYELSDVVIDCSRSFESPPR